MTRVLIVDDDELFRRLVARSILEAGYEAELREVSRVRQAREVLATWTPDLVVVDDLLPDGRGIDVVEALREVHPGVHVAYLAIFWQDYPTYRYLTGNLRVDLVLTKPLSGPELVVQLGHLLGLGGGGDARPDDGPGGEAGARPGGAASREPPPGTGIPLASPAPAGRANHAELPVATFRELARCGAPGDPVALPPGETATEGGDETPTILLAIDDEALGRRLAELAERALLRTVRCPIREWSTRRPLAEPFACAVVEVDADHDALRVVTRALDSPGSARRVPVAMIAEEVTVSDRIRAAHAGASLVLDAADPDEALSEGIELLVARGRERRPVILVVETGDACSAWLRSILDPRRVQLERLDRVDELLDVMGHLDPEVVVLATQLWGLSGFAICKLLRATPEWADVSVLFVIERPEPNQRAAVFEAGGDDYLDRAAPLAEVLGRVQGRLDRGALRKDRLLRDPLTTLLNRRGWMAEIGKRLDEAQREGRPLALGVVDVDRFKQVNDAYGHLAGDRVLARLGRLLAQRIRFHDVVARWGGEEIAVAFEGRTPEVAGAILERFREELEALEFRSDAGESFHVSFSAGVAAFPGDGTSHEELIRVADRRLRLAKRRGRARVVVSDAAAGEAHP